ncbi:unnamed protein product [Cyprideis torosa]|uniref:Methionine aminopeptidase n=1 Tax=Cyprideis torosa TaxID=163714 RepID=A0A7R8WRR9_9CRUS|nr:unnamed protein product [Cyprideis torosa]CAG0908904.1 unnamed protein product [Cyprideis torosa]
MVLVKPKKWILKTDEEIELIRLSAQLVSQTLGMIAKEIKPGVTTKRLDVLAEAFIQDHGGKPGFKGMYDFPATLCVSPNEQVVHGIPNETPLKEGDILSVDCGVYMNGFYGDHAYTFAIGDIDEEKRKLLQTTKASLYLGIAQCVKGKRIGDIANAIQRHCEENGYGVVRELVGHGLGKNLHEEPQLPNYGRAGQGKLLENGLVLAIEPMINMGTHRVKFHKDGWTVTTQDHLASAHFEHNVAIVAGQARLLSTFDYVHEALGVAKDLEEDDFR